MNDESTRMLDARCTDTRIQTGARVYRRAWIQAQTPLSTLRLVTHFLPVSKSFSIPVEEVPRKGTVEYYLKCVGGQQGLARLYLNGGLLPLDGSAAQMMSSTYSALSSIRTPEPRRSPSNENGEQIWRRDRESARRFFERARQLCPQMDIPFLPPADIRGEGAVGDLQMPTVDGDQSMTTVLGARPAVPPAGERRQLRRRRQEAEAAVNAILEQADIDRDDEDNTWYLYLPGLIGAGTALLVVGVVSALSFSSWRKNQN